jgi:adenylate kinase family enzyme
MHKICVMGCSGGGKTTFAALLAQSLELPHLELDSLYHQAGWNSLSTAEFRARVEKFTSHDEWVVDGNYITEVGDITWGGADSIIWLDTPRLVATARVVRRTLVVCSFGKSCGMETERTGGRSYLETLRGRSSCGPGRCTTSTRTDTNRR